MTPRLSVSATEALALVVSLHSTQAHARGVGRCVELTSTTAQARWHFDGSLQASVSARKRDREDSQKGGGAVPGGASEADRGRGGSIGEVVEVLG